MDIRKIMELLPHRFPMLLVDRILENEPGVRCKGLKNVSINEAFFQGHYPGDPIMPGVLIVESMAQTAAVLFLSNEGGFHDLVPLLGGLDDVKFKRQVKPGDTLIIDAELLWMRNSMGRVKASATVEGNLVASMELTFKIAKPEKKTK